MIETLRQIGAKISNTPSQEIDSRDSKVGEETKQSEEKQYVVYANINSTDEDFTFLITALYHWETLYPTFTLDLPKDPNEIVIKEKSSDAPKSEEEKKQQLPEIQALESLQAKIISKSLENDANVDLQELMNL